MSDSPENRTTTDNSGAVVRVGSLVRIVQIPEFFAKPLPQLDRERLLSMIGEVFEVYEIDEHGQAWVEKWWHENDDIIDAHSLGLKPEQVLLVVHNRM